jgi:hypothetical protein
MDRDETTDSVTGRKRARERFGRLLLRAKRHVVNRMPMVVRESVILMRNVGGVRRGRLHRPSGIRQCDGWAVPKAHKAK